MDEQIKDQLSRIHNKLTIIERELAGYGTLMSGIYGDVMISGRDLAGPAQALSKNSRTIQKILHQLDLIIIREGET